MAHVGDVALSGAHVEIIEYGGPLSGPLLPRCVRVNGVDVGFIDNDGIQVDPGDHNRPASVTLKLLPRLIEIKQGAA